MQMLHLKGIIQQKQVLRCTIVDALFQPNDLPYAFPTKLISTLHFPQLTKNGQLRNFYFFSFRTSFLLTDTIMKKRNLRTINLSDVPPSGTWQSIFLRAQKCFVCIGGSFIFCAIVNLINPKTYFTLTYSLFNNITCYATNIYNNHSNTYIKGARAFNSSLVSPACLCSILVGTQRALSSSLIAA